jgi:hypothetical protein
MDFGTGLLLPFALGAVMLVLAYWTSRQPWVIERVSDLSAQIRNLKHRRSGARPGLWSAGASARITEKEDAAKPRILFCLAHPGFLRNFAQTVEQLACDAHVQLHFSKRHRTIALEDYKLKLDGASPIECTFQLNNEENEPSDAEVIRLLRDIIAYSRPEYREAKDIYQRFRSLQKGGPELRRIIGVLQDMIQMLPTRAKREVELWLRQREACIAPRADAAELMFKFSPDLVVVSPYVNFGSREVDVVKAARVRGIPTVLAVASWDNLTNKGVIQVPTDYVAVWNSHMAKEAVSLHDVARERIWITGSPVFDPWFERRPSQNRIAFCRKVGLDPARPILVYVCSSESIAGPDEHAIIVQWMSAIGRATDENTRTANILVRPHPMNLERWRERLFAEEAGRQIGHLERAIVWPIAPKHPTTEEGRAEFYDTLYYADAIVGLNTSAMIESAILRKPVLTFRGHLAESSQTGNQHFKYLTGSGLVIEASDLDSHIDQLASVLANPEPQAIRCDAFVADFVRPLGTTVGASATLARHLLGLVKVTPSGHTQ